MIIKLKSFANNAASKTNGTKLKIKLDSTLYKKEKILYFKSRCSSKNTNN